MNTSIQKIQDKTLDAFLASSKEEQRKFMNSINMNELKETANHALLKKFIVMKVLMEARHTAEDKSLFNMTAQFRNVLGWLIPALSLGADYGPPSAGREIRGPYCRESYFIQYEYVTQPGEGSKSDASKGYRFFHINQMGSQIWERKFFYLGWDIDYNIVTEHKKTKRGFTYHRTTPDNITTTWDVMDNATLRRLFAEIKKEASYENTLGYDLYCAATFCIVALLDLSTRSGWSSILFVPLALAITVATYAFVIPLSLMLYTVEELLVNPIKWTINALLPDEHEVFIDEVCQPEPQRNRSY